MDLSNYSADMAAIPFEVIIKHPISGKETDNIISVVGVDSPAAQAVLDIQQTKRFNELAVSTEENKSVFDAVQQRHDTVELLVACTVGWKNVMWKGELLEFTQDNVRFIYDKVPTIREQINRAVGSRKNFFKD